MEALTENFQNNPVINPVHHVHILKLTEVPDRQHLCIISILYTEADFQSTSNPDRFFFTKQIFTAQVIAC
jgi:hypothetical protein